MTIDPNMMNWVIVILPAIPPLLILLAYRSLLSTKRKELVRLLEGDGETKYRDAFGRYYEDTFEAYYSRRAYSYAAISFVIIACGVMLAACENLKFPLPGVPSSFATLFSPIGVNSFAGAAGAYLSGTYAMVERYKNRDLYPTAIHEFWLSIVVGALLGPIAAAPVVAPGDTLAALAIGALPLRSVWQFLRSKAPTTEEKVSLRESQWELLDGVSQSLLERFEDQGIGTVQSLAYADPVRLLLTTNLEWNVILDLIDQSILILYVGPRIDAFRAIGVRSAVDAASINERIVASVKYKGKNPQKAARRAADAAVAQGLLSSIATVQGFTQFGAENLCWQFNNDPVIQFLWIFWNVSMPSNEPLVAIVPGAGANEPAVADKPPAADAPAAAIIPGSATNAPVTQKD